MAEETAPTNITQWTFRTVLIAFFLALMTATGYLYKENVKLYERLAATGEAKATLVLELTGCKAENKVLRGK